jgi:uncharacterized protein (TIGR03437 family)
VIQLGGRYSVRVSWGLGRSEPACLSFLGAGQVNFKLPAGLAEGQLAAIAVHDAASGIIAQQGPLIVGPVEPGLFTKDSSGTGIASGQIFRRVDGQETFVNLTDEPILLQLESDSLVLVLYGTGIRGRAADSIVRATVAGRPAIVTYAGSQGDLLGFDQINLEIPTAPLIGDRVNGRVSIEIEIETGGRVWRANPVQVALSSDPPA